MHDFFSFLESEYRRLGEQGSRALSAIRRLAPSLVDRHGEIKIMHLCGTHEDTVTRNGLRSLLPEGIALIAGPGCPVCVTPASVIDSSIDLAKEGLRIYAYGDLYRVPGTIGSLAKARASEDCDIRVVYGFSDALKIEMEDRKESVFLGVGFETTAPTVASLVSKGRVPENVSIVSSYRLTAPGLNHAMRLHKEKNIPLRGVIAPGHVSTITGARAWTYIPEEYAIPAVVAGFEPLDVIFAVLEILRQLKEGIASLVNEYSRVVRWERNEVAWGYVQEVFDVVDSHWRGIGVLEESGLELKHELRGIDAIAKYDLHLDSKRGDLRSGCRCAEVTLGLAVPSDCPFFASACTPSHPIGPCMVSSEGTCNVWVRFGGEKALRESIGGEESRPPRSQGDAR